MGTNKMASGLIGVWALDKNENYEAFLKACGMGSMKRGFVAKLGGSITVSKVAEDKYKFTVVNGPKTKERLVTFGQEFEEDGVDGGKVKGKWEVVDGKLVGNFTGNWSRPWKQGQWLLRDFTKRNKICVFVVLVVNHKLVLVVLFEILKNCKYFVLFIYKNLCHILVYSQ